MRNYYDILKELYKKKKACNLYFHNSEFNLFKDGKFERKKFFANP